MKQKPLLTINDNNRTAIKADGTVMQVIDSPMSTIIQPNEEDIKKGIPGDHANCMYCVTCRRLFDSELVWVTRNVAYVELKGKKGKPELHRFILKMPAKENVKGFDLGANVTPEAVIFAKPEGARTLDYSRKTWQKRKEREKTGRKKAYVKGKSTLAKKHELNPVASLRAAASGMFHFHPGEDKNKPVV